MGDGALCGLVVDGVTYVLVVVVIVLHLRLHALCHAVGIGVACGDARALNGLEQHVGQLCRGHGLQAVGQGVGAAHVVGKGVGEHRWCAVAAEGVLSALVGAGGHGLGVAAVKRLAHGDGHTAHALLGGAVDDAAREGECRQRLERNVQGVVGLDHLVEGVGGQCILHGHALRHAHGTHDGGAGHLVGKLVALCQVVAAGVEPVDGGLRGDVGGAGRDGGRHGAQLLHVVEIECDALALEFNLYGVGARQFGALLVAEHGHIACVAHEGVEGVVESVGHHVAVALSRLDVDKLEGHVFVTAVGACLGQIDLKTCHVVLHGHDDDGAVADVVLPALGLLVYLDRGFGHEHDEALVHAVEHVAVECGGRGGEAGEFGQCGGAIECAVANACDARWQHDAREVVVAVPA